MPKGRNLARDLQLKPALWAKIAAPPVIASLKLSAKATQLPIARQLLERHGRQALEGFIHRQLGANKADYRSKV